jgi:hypothetical protein
MESAAAVTMGRAGMKFLFRASVAALCAAAVTGRTAAAEPVATPASCAVDLVRAPDDVRAVVERWIRAEPHCSVALEVRIIPTDGGLYVLARDNRGRTHERVVPDANGAGVLIASWAADASLGPPAARPPDAREPAQPEPAATAWPVPREPSRWIGLTGMTELVAIGGRDQNDTHGGRADVDLGSPGAGFVIGLAASVTRGDHSAGPSFPTSITAITDVAVVAEVEFPARLGDWQLTPSVGGGGGYTHAHALNERTDTISLIGQASLMLSYRLAPRIALVTGPLVTTYSQHTFASSDVVRNMDLMISGGVRWGL